MGSEAHRLLRFAALCCAWFQGLQKHRICAAASPDIADQGPCALLNTFLTPNNSSGGKATCKAMAMPESKIITCPATVSGMSCAQHVRYLLLLEVPGWSVMAQGHKHSAPGAFRWIGSDPGESAGLRSKRGVKPSSTTFSLRLIFRA